MTAIAQGKSVPSPHGFTIDDGGSRTLAITVMTRLAMWLGAIIVPWVAIVALVS